MTMMAKTLAIGFLSLFLQPNNSAVAFSFNAQPSTSKSKHEMQTSLPRRSFLKTATTAAALITTTIIPTASNAVVFDSSVASKTWTLQPLTEEEAEARFRAGRESLNYLSSHYDEICNGGGDNVRSYLGTVGTSSGLFGISKAMKALAERADDIVEYTELSMEIEQCIQQADGFAYYAIFVTTSTSATSPEKYFKDAKIEIERCAKSMDELAAMIGIKF